jgi:hypothetical protein
MLKAGVGQRSGIRAALVLLACFLAGNAAPVVIARVQDGETKRALAGALVMSEGSDIMAVTDSSGQCLVVALPKRGGMLVASRTGYLDARLPWSAPSKPVPDTVTIDLLLYPNRPRVVVGRVTDAGTRLAVVGARVSVVGTELAESTTDDGGFLFSRFPVGPQTLEVSSTGYPLRTFNVEVKGGDTTEVNAPLVDTTNAGRVEGTVFDVRTGLVVPEARVAVDGTELGMLTDSTGRYVIENVPAGMHKLLVSRAGYVNAYTVLRLVEDWTVTVNLYLREPASRPPVRVK